MNKSNNLQFFLMFLVFFGIVILIGKYFIDIVVKEEGINTRETELVSVSPDRKISWTEITEMIKACEVVQVSQTHDLRVSVVTKGDQIFWTYQPELDDILTLATQASQDCEMDIIQITE